jgi:hypothetical protein
MSKYKSRKVVADGMVFDSRKEYQRWCELSLLEKAGEIHNLQRQVKYVVIPAQKENGKTVERQCSYIADFVYEKDGKTVVEDVKGYKKGQAYAVFSIKRKLMLKEYGIRIVEV